MNAEDPLCFINTGHNCRFDTIIMSGTLKVTGYHACHVWPQCMISKGNHVKFARFMLLPVSEKAKT